MFTRIRRIAVRFCPQATCRCHLFDQFFKGQRNLDGLIPSQLGNLSNLRKLFLHRNRLNGSIPPELGSLYNLTELLLSSNGLSGPIPPQLANLSNLTRLDLSRNQLSGPTPVELRILPNLKKLTLDERNQGSRKTQLDRASVPIPSTPTEAWVEATALQKEEEREAVEATARQKVKEQVAAKATALQKEEEREAVEATALQKEVEQVAAEAAARQQAEKQVSPRQRGCMELGRGLVVGLISLGVIIGLISPSEQQVTQGALIAWLVLGLSALIGPIGAIVGLTTLIRRWRCRGLACWADWTGCNDWAECGDCRDD